MSELKVGDKFIDMEGNRVTVLAVAYEMLIYEDKEQEDSCSIEMFLKHFKSYQEPVPVKRIVAHIYENGESVYLSLENSNDCIDRDTRSNCKRIELLPEHFGWAK